MKQILVNTYLSKEERIAGVIDAEYEMTNSWRDKGIIEHLFAKENHGEAIVLFNEADIEHWHGATATSGMTHIAVTNFDGDELVTWLGPVTDDEFKQVNQ